MTLRLRLTHTRLFAAILLVLAYSHCAWATDATLTGTVRGPFGNAFNGQIIMTLSQPAIDPTGIIDYIPLQVPFTVLNGSLQAGAKVVSNESLEPKNTYYLAQYFDPTGGMVAQKVFYFVNGANALGSMAATSITTNNVSYLTPVSLSANNTFTGINTFSQKIISTVTAGTPPFQINSPTKVSLLTAAALITDGPFVPSAGLIRLSPSEFICWGTSGGFGNKCLKSTDGSAEYTLGFNGVDYPASLSHYSNVASAGLPIVTVNTLAETAMTSNASIPGNTVGPTASAKTQAIRLHASGVLTNTSGGNVTYTFRWRADTTGAVYCASAGVVVATGATNVPWHLDCVMTSMVAGGAGTVDAWGNYTVNATTGDIANAALVALDTTVGHIMTITGQMSVANANASQTLRSIYQERMGSQP